MCSSETRLIRQEGCAVFSNSRLEQMALVHVVQRLGGGKVPCGFHDIRSYKAIRSKMARPSLILSGLDGETCQNGTLRRLEEHFPSAWVVVFPQETRRLDNLDMLPANVRAILSSDLTEEQISRAIEFVEIGYVLFPRQSAEPRAVQASEPRTAQARRQPPSRPPELTEREWQVCREISSGRSNKEIARALGIAVNTVNVHVGSIRRKLRVNNRTQIALRVANKLVEAKNANSRMGPLDQSY